MVHGLELFKKYFYEYNDQYVLIGGAACDILLNDLGNSFRATKDLDIVLIIDQLDVNFAKTFWEFIEKGGYKHLNKSNGKEQFYRFSHPENLLYPTMIELFSRKPVFVDHDLDSRLVPIHVDEAVVSLSAIIINDSYYDVLLTGKIIIDGYSIINIETIILFKIKAWLDLTSQSASGISVDSRNIKKHKNDIFRLLVFVLPGRQIVVHDEIKNDVQNFIELIADDKVDLRNLGIRSRRFDELIQILNLLFV
ncbi:MAG TPA: hypothetical protein DCM45_00070 [Clostridiales bacterium]|nr:hypothetical protein [Clostridiales bacterium]